MKPNMPQRLSRALSAGFVAGAVALSCAFAPMASAQDDQMRAIATPAQPNAIPLNTGRLPDASVEESWHSQYGSVFVRNVTDATLTPFLPDPAKATGAAVIIAPGGGFRSLSMENEGWVMAQRLADQGVAAFVLKYRLNQTPATLEEFASPPPRPTAAPGAAPGGAGAPARNPFMANHDHRIADVTAAFNLVRANAQKWGVDPDRIGMAGFSAGAMLTMSTALTTDLQPAFIVNVYGSMSAVEVPADAPPLFAVIAADDPLFPVDFGLIINWRKANRPVEFHYFEQGGHGFGMYDKTTTSTQWFPNFLKWLEMHGYLKKKGA